MKKYVSIIVLLPCLAFAEGRDAFVVQQAYAEMQRIQGQVSVIQSNLNDLQSRVARLESGNDNSGLRREVEALKAEVASLRRQLGTQRDSIVRDLSSRLSKMQQPPAPAPKQAQKVVIGPHQEYVVEKGDTLSVISQATGVPVRKIREVNNLKNDNLRLGQKLILPK